MFGRAKFVNGDALFNEMLDAIHLVSLLIDNLNLECNDHDYERMTVWNASSVVCSIKMWGRTDDASRRSHSENETLSRKCSMFSVRLRQRRIP